MRMVTADNLSYVSVRTSKVLVVKLPKNLIFDSQKGVSRGFRPLRILERGRKWIQKMRLITKNVLSHVSYLHQFEHMTK